MWVYGILLILCICNVTPIEDDKEPILYYYRLEESERTLPVCARRQACSAFIARSWLPPALVRLCACPRPLRCDAPAHTHAPSSFIAINNRDYLQFCQPITDWPTCAFNDVSLSIETTYDRLNPDELEAMHHRNVQLTPPKITFECRCREPNYWKLKTESESIKTYQCGSLPLCRTDEFCGNVNYELNTLYQSCLCPKNHICFHNGGITHITIAELLYQGRGWRAYCQKINQDSEDDYYYSF